MPINGSLLESLSRVGFTHPPVAIAFLASPPNGLPRVSQAEAASCGYWKEASEGRAFYTTPEDHSNCPVGAYTHGVELTPEKGQELQSLIGTMIELKYITGDEVPSIPKRNSALNVAAYAPLTQATFAPDVIVFRGNARQIMLLSEAARSAGAFDAASVMGRPACSMLPQALAAKSGVASIGCIGNRVYTGLGDDELYLTIPGAQIDDVLAKVDEIVTANTELEKFHQQRAARLRA